MNTQNIKYTTDGRKVVVIGNLNSQEKIVQEVFIVNDVEIPSGENFVVKSLHDAPAISWKEKSIKETEVRYETEHRENLRKIEVLQKEYNLKSSVIKAKLQFLKKLELNLTEEKLDQLISFISGRSKFIVMDAYSDIEIADYDESITDKDYGRFDALRLVSIFGRTDGELEFRRNDYSDGSGSWRTVIPCETKEEALEILKNRFFDKLDEKGANNYLLKTAEKYNLEIPEDILKVYRDKQKEQVLNNIKHQEEILEKYKEQLENIK